MKLITLSASWEGIRARGVGIIADKAWGNMRDKWSRCRDRGILVRVNRGRDRGGTLFWYGMGVRSNSLLYTYTVKPLYSLLYWSHISTTQPVIKSM